MEIVEVTAIDCEKAPDSEPYLQGDVLRRVLRNDASTYWVIISADCDLVQQKLGDAGIICIELVPLRDYLAKKYSRTLLARQRKKTNKELTEWVSGRWIKLHGADSALDPMAIAQWIQTAPIIELEEALQLKTASELTYFRHMAMALKSAFACPPDADAQEVITCLTKLQKKMPTDRADFIRLQLSRLEANQLPDDLFFVSEVPGEESLGYLALLRSTTIIKLTDLVSSVQEARERNFAYLRIGRLKTVYKHGIAQQFGFLFSRIGYPKPYEDERAAAFELATEQLSVQLGVLP